MIKLVRAMFRARWMSAILTAYLVTVPMTTSTVAQNIEPFKAELTIRADQPQGTINRNIYGQFAEHLGRLIYGVSGRD